MLNTLYNHSISPSQGQQLFSSAENCLIEALSTPPELFEVCLQAPPPPFQAWLQVCAGLPILGEVTLSQRCWFNEKGFLNCSWSGVLPGEMLPGATDPSKAPQMYSVSWLKQHCKYNRYPAPFQDLNFLTIYVAKLLFRWRLFYTTINTTKCKTTMYKQAHIMSHVSEIPRMVHEYIIIYSLSPEIRGVQAIYSVWALWFW